MSTIHQRQAGGIGHDKVLPDGPCTSGQMTFSVEPSSAPEREAQEIHDALQQCQGMLGAHEVTPWRRQITVSRLVLNPDQQIGRTVHFCTHS